MSVSVNKGRVIFEIGAYRFVEELARDGTIQGSLLPSTHNTNFETSALRQASQGCLQPRIHPSLGTPSTRQYVDLSAQTNSA